MRKLLIPLLAAIALPTAVNAEIINLECIAEWSQTDGDKKTIGNPKPEYIDIDTVKESTTIDNGYDLKKYNTFIARDIFILTRINSEDYAKEDKYEISRLNGNYLLTSTPIFLDPNSPFFDKTAYEIVMNDPDNFSVLISPYKQGGTCKKAEKVKTMF